MKRILFVCTGNTCRSPMAEEMMRQLAEEFGIELEVRSAGIAAYDGLPASDHTQTLLRERGWDETHISQGIDEDLINWADLILTMTKSHRDAIYSLCKEREELPCFTLKEYANYLTQQEQASSLDIQDPFGGDLETYRKCSEEIEKLLRSILEVWKKE